MKQPDTAPRAQEAAPLAEPAERRLAREVLAHDARTALTARAPRVRRRPLLARRAIVLRDQGFAPFRVR
jgi:hypothetical protein